MMLIDFLSLLVPGLLAGQASAGMVRKSDTWGGALSLGMYFMNQRVHIRYLPHHIGPTTSHIVKATTTLIPGVAPQTQAGQLFLWPGMSNGTGNLIQTTLEQWPDNSWCGAKTGQWCIRASLFGLFPETKLQQIDGPDAVVAKGDQIKIVYTRGEQLDDYSWTWTQNVTNAVTGAYLSSFSHPSGPMTG